MRFALDFDETFSRDPSFWREFCHMARLSGHNIVIVTARDEHNDGIDWSKVDSHGAPSVPIIWCDGCPKKAVVEMKGIRIDVWIDDNPSCIVRPSPLSEAALMAWRSQDKYRASKYAITGYSKGSQWKELTNA